MGAGDDASDGRYVVPLSTLGPPALPIAGGKAANLGALLRVGMPVPAGFCVTTRAYAEAAETAGLAAELDTLAAADRADPVRLADRAAAIRARVLATPVPAGVVEEITNAYRGLGAEEAVAVRSSATAEDLPTASFAGQQDTY